MINNLCIIDVKGNFNQSIKRFLNSIIDYINSCTEKDFSIPKNLNIISSTNSWIHKYYMSSSQPRKESLQFCSEKLKSSSFVLQLTAFFCTKNPNATGLMEKINCSFNLVHILTCQEFFTLTQLIKIWFDVIMFSHTEIRDGSDDI